MALVVLPRCTRSVYTPSAVLYCEERQQLVLWMFTLNVLHHGLP